jgi:hypothetical protein
MVGMARSMIKAKGLPRVFWGEAVNTAVYILNRSPTRSLDGKAPYEAWHKLDDRSTPMIFVGYEAGSKAYRVYNPVDGCVNVTRDAVFDEDAQWDWGVAGEGGRTGGADEFVAECLVFSEQVVGGEPAGRSPTAENSPPATTMPGATPSAPTTPGATKSAPTMPGATQSTPTTPRAPVTSSAPIKFVSPPSDIDDMLDAEHDDDVPAWFRGLDDVLGPESPPGMAPRVLGGGELLFVSAEVPTTFKEAEQEECWRRAMEAEMQSIEENKTWSLVDLLPGHKPIGLKWVFKVKRDEHGTIVKHKERLVAKGYVQRPGIDFDEVFTPVARLESVRMLLAVVAHEGWEVHHMDVKSAFLNGDLQEEVYVAQPAGFVVEGAEHMVLKLKKALYGLRQAPSAWNVKLDSCLLSLGFQKSKVEHGVYTRGTGEARLVVGVYVDDLIITGHSGIDKFKAEMK